MGRRDYRRCKRCGIERSETLEMSHTRLCPDCGHDVLHDNIDGLHFHRGEALERWRRGMAAAVGGVLLDDLERLL